MYGVRLDAAPSPLTAMIGAGLFPQGFQPAPVDPHSVDWDDLLARARCQQVESLLWSALNATSLVGGVPPAARAVLEQAYWHARVSNLLVMDELTELLAAFAQAQVPVVVLKGAALAFTLYDNPALRRLGDVDLLVHAEHRTRAAALLEGQQFVSCRDMKEGPLARCRHEQAFRRCGRTPLQLDLHWALSGHAYWRRRTPMTWIWHQTIPWQIGGQPALMLAPEAQLLHLCAHSSQHGAPTLRWTYDIALLLTRRVIDWDLVLAVAPGFGLTLALQSTLSSVRNLWGIGQPPAVEAALHALAIPWRERALCEFINVDQGRGLAILDGCGQADLRVTLAVWWFMAFPEPAFMRKRYRFQRACWLPVYYAYRAVTGVFRSGRAALRAIWRTVRTQVPDNGFTF